MRYLGLLDKAAFCHKRDKASVRIYSNRKLKEDEVNRLVYMARSYGAGYVVFEEDREGRKVASFEFDEPKVKGSR